MFIGLVPALSSARHDPTPLAPEDAFVRRPSPAAATRPRLTTPSAGAKSANSSTGDAGSFFPSLKVGQVDRLEMVQTAERAKEVSEDHYDDIVASLGWSVSTMVQDSSGVGRSLVIRLGSPLGWPLLFCFSKFVCSPTPGRTRSPPTPRAARR